MKEQAATNKQSPAWRNPRDSMRRHLSRKSNRNLAASLKSAAQPTITATDLISTESCPPPDPTKAPNQKEKENPNPFNCGSPMKKKKKLGSDDKPKANGNAAGPLKMKSPSFAEIDDGNANDCYFGDADTEAETLRSRTRSSDAKQPTRKSFFRNASTIDPTMKELELFPTDFSGMTDFSPIARIEPALPEELTSYDVPLDVRIGSKIKITSSKPFPWIKSINTTGNALIRMTGTDRHDGLNCFMRSLADAKSMENPELIVSSSASAISLIEAGCLYWQFPSLPWMSLHPRIDALLSTLPRRAAAPMAPTMIDMMNKQWAECFEQLFLSWKKGARKSFYVNCSSFTIFFNKTELNEIAPAEDSMSCFQTTEGQSHIAVLTPTTEALRFQLRTAGVEFEVCSSKNRRLSRRLSLLKNENSLLGSSSATTSFIVDLAKDTDAILDGINKENDDIEKKDSDTDSSPSKTNQPADQEWLNAVGVSPRKSIMISRMSSMNAASSSMHIGSKGSDTKKDACSIIVKSSSVQVLYNMLQSSKFGKTIAGLHANLPPTLLAAQPFLYANMLSLKKSSQSIKRVNHAMEYVLELDGGPILPHTVAMLVEFIRRANLCTDEPVLLRVNDKTAYNGLNDFCPDPTEWTELRISTDEIKWCKKT